MTTTDTLKLYATLHADVPETRPKAKSSKDYLAEYSPNVWKWTDDYGAWSHTTYDNYAAASLCRCAALEWACRKVGWVGDLRNELDRWFYDLPHKDSRLIDICRAIHTAKGKTK